MEERRSTVMINPKIQVRLVGLVLLSGFVTFIMAAGFFWLNWRLYSTVLANSAVNGEPVRDLLLYYGFLTTAGFLVIMTILTLVTLIVSNRIVGPLYRLRKDMDEMIKEEDVELFSVRDHDYIDDFVRELNRFLLVVRRSDKVLLGDEVKEQSGPPTDQELLEDESS